MQNVLSPVSVKDFHDHNQSSPVLEKSLASIVSVPSGLPGPSGVVWLAWARHAGP